jgi:membrane-associated protease RseP (regulator of RpoE activity)
MLFYWISLGGGLLMTLMVHELGHLLAARWCGVRVLSISIGVGPELCGFTDRFGTRWRLAALPLGGSLGMRDKALSAEQPLASQANFSDAFSAKPIKQQATIYLAGPVFSLLLAGGLVGVLLSLYGQDALHVTKLDRSDIVACLMVSELSLFIGVLNLLPFPPLDGGRLLLLGIEAFRAKRVLEHVQTQISRAGLIIVFQLTLASILYSMALAVGCPW